MTNHVIAAKNFPPKMNKHLIDLHLLVTEEVLVNRIFRLRQRQEVSQPLPLSLPYSKQKPTLDVPLKRSIDEDPPSPPATPYRSYS